MNKLKSDNDIVCTIRDEYDTLMRNRDLTRVDILKAFENLAYKLTRTYVPAPMENCMRVYYRRNKNSEVESIECYSLISVGHIGNNHYRVLYNKDGVERNFQIDKCNLVGVEGI